MSRIGTVRELNGKYAVISSSRRGICEGCSDKSSCSFDNALGKSVPEHITVINSIQAVPGDRVEFDLVGHTELKFSLIVWTIPLLGLIMGAFLGSFYHFLLGITADTGTLAGSGVGLALGFAVVIGYDRFIVDQEKSLPVLIKVLKSDPCTSQQHT